jgi:7-cyano-7-deazaguanine reductase
MNIKHSPKSLADAPLGKTSENPNAYSPEILFPIPRSENRQTLGLADSTKLPFFGVDIWNAYEISWLGLTGKPEVAIAQIQTPAESPFIFESKSLKLYLNSLNHSRFTSIEEVQSIIAEDLSKAAGAKVSVKLSGPELWPKLKFKEFEGKLLDRLNLEIDPNLGPDKSWLSAKEDESPVEETLISNLLRSNCPVTGQPDWASVQIHYVGPEINEEGLLRYLIAFRQHQEFHEHCVEKIFCDIKAMCKPSKLSVYARYTRRGGIDINPFRTDFNAPWPENIRQARQ